MGLLLGEELCLGGEEMPVFLTHSLIYAKLTASTMYYELVVNQILYHFA